VDTVRAFGLARTRGFLRVLGNEQAYGVRFTRGVRKVIEWEKDMYSSRISNWWSNATCLLVVASAALIQPVSARAAEGKLSVQASPQVIYNGQSAQVNVFAHFAGPPAPYAFASSTFDIHASEPAWTFASTGAIVGNDVFAATASQAHMPQLGTFANPSNPYRVWHGAYTPQSNAPALIEIEANPIDFSVYPSKFTSSSASCPAVGGSDFILANPLRIGRRWLAAPGQGTSIQIHDDVIADGQIITGENWNSVSVGLLPTGSTGRGSYAIMHGAVDPALTPSDTNNGRTWSGPIVLSSSSTIGFSSQPVTFTATVQLLGAGDDVYQWDPGDGNDTADPGPQRSRIGSLTVTFSGLETGGYAVGGHFVLADGSVRSLRYTGFTGGITVAAGDLDGDANDGVPGLVVSSLPKTLDARTGRLYVGSETGVWRLAYDQPIVAFVRGPNGQSMPATIHFIEVAGGSVDGPAVPTPSSNNLRQMSLGVHHFEAKGAQQMTIKPTSGH